MPASTPNESARQQFEDAFDGLFAASERLAMSMTGSAAVSEDVACEALARTWASWGRLHRVDWAEAWVLKVTANLCMDHWRRQGRQALVPADERLASAVDDHVVRRVSLTHAVARLPKRQREVVVLRLLADMSERDVAAALRMRTGTVGAHLNRGLASLRTAMTEEVADDAD